MIKANALALQRGSSFPNWQIPVPAARNNVHHSVLLLDADCPHPVFPNKCGLDVLHGNPRKQSESGIPILVACILPLELAMYLP
jgi:hypothetical protein